MDVWLEEQLMKIHGWLVILIEDIMEKKIQDLIEEKFYKYIIIKICNLLK